MLIYLLLNVNKYITRMGMPVRLPLVPIKGNCSLIEIHNLAEQMIKRMKEYSHYINDCRGVSLKHLFFYDNPEKHLFFYNNSVLHLFFYNNSVLHVF